jgi:hypothetical protein
MAGLENPIERTTPMKVAELKIRLPLDVQTWLRREAARYGSSLNGEVVRALRKRMEQRQDQKGTINADN